ncbi:hypothetical protein [Sinomicrobium weinanense]|uniref:Uncharacterized protein n=1 Tax=Sinomicrobium weinanense TaxID=2842200 RepID=A0A926JRT8_9FLAO|nr:hypothetical protein [Sinomicrobium weinanense]MBC9796139.1 hypothetical protein [Sinomicrobium weinanense]MBU3121890.1 hypothetical protein [Sinomicrobium weinanense]
MLVRNIPPGQYSYKKKQYIPGTGFDVDSYMANMKGNIYLWQGEPEKAVAEFEQVAGRSSSYKGFSDIPADIFGYNRIECFGCPSKEIMQTDYLQTFPFIKPVMNKRELAKALIELKKTGEKDGPEAARANYLLGNFYYNTSLIGYYRHILTFSNTNGKSSKFHNYYSWGGQYKERVPEYYLYFKDYKWNPLFRDHFNRPLAYLQRALEQAENDELKARILFAASKCEQGIFYSTQNDKELNNLKNINYKAREKKRLEIKTSRYRSYFQKLRAYRHTSFYKEVRTNCKYFEYYTTHY